MLKRQTNLLQDRDSIELSLIGKLDRALNLKLPLMWFQSIPRHKVDQICEIKQFKVKMAQLHTKTAQRCKDLQACLYK